MKEPAQPRKTICKYVGPANQCTTDATWSVRVLGSSIFDETEACNRHLAAICNGRLDTLGGFEVMVRRLRKG